MASDSIKLQPKWLAEPPSAFDVVATYFPESKPKGAIKLRPCLVLDVLRGKASGGFACRIAYGTKNLKSFQRQNLDIIVQNASDLSQMRLPVATRFDLDHRNVVVLPWNEGFFGCWAGYSSPKICTLPEEYVKEYFYIMALRQANRSD